MNVEITELILASVDLLAMAQTFDADELKGIFDGIRATADGDYLVYLNAVENMIANAR